MKFMSILIFYIWHFLIDVVISTTESAENTYDPYIGSELQRTLGMQPISCKGRSIKPRHSSSLPSYRSAPRYDEMTPEERQERLNQASARFMQLLTFMGHVDNYLTDKLGGLIKTMGRAIETEDDEEVENDAYGGISRRQTQTRIKTTITS